MITVEKVKSGGSSPWLMAVVLGVLLLGVYWPALNGGMLWDDAAHVTRPELRSWAGLGRIWWEMNATQQYYPVLHSAFWVEQRLWGESTLGYHLLNVALHAACCWLLALTLDRLRKIGPGAQGPDLSSGAGWLAALLFAVHPVCVESVAWISEQKNTLSLLFYLLAALAYLNYEATDRRNSYVKASLFFLLALGTKSVTATLPAALLLVLWWRKGRLTWREIRPLLPWFLVSLFAGAITAWIERKLIGAEGAAFDVSLGERVLLAGRVIWFYLGKLVWPADLMFVYPHWDVAREASRWSGYLIATVGLTGGLWLMRRRSRGPLAAWLFFCGSLFPVLGFFNVYPFIFSYVADHFQYLPAMGLLAAAALATARLLAAAPSGLRVGGWIAVAGLIVVLAVQSQRQSRLYADSETLYRQTIAKNPDCWMAMNNLALELAKSPTGKTEAIARYEQALRIKPDYAEAHNNLGVELAKYPNRISAAISHYRQALQIQPNYAEAHSNLASVLAKIPGQEADAIAHYEQALQLKPEYPEIHYNLANALANFPERRPTALLEYEKALQLNPGYAEARYNFANTLAKIPGRESEAAVQYEILLKAKPDYADARVAYANLLAKMPGREADAVAQYEQALLIQSGVAGVHFNLANILARTPGKLPTAFAHYEEALRLRPDYLDAHIAYANELAKLPDRSDDAIAQYRKALRIDPDLPEVHYALGLQLSNDPAHQTGAISEYETALRLNPEYAAAHNNLGIAYAQQGRLDEAAKHFERALELAPDYEDARKNLELLKQMRAR